MFINYRPFIVALIVALLFWPLPYSMAETPSSSVSSIIEGPSIRGLVPAPAVAINPDNIITFSEYPIGTPITTQYANRGIIFAGDSPFITPDGANPTSPVLSGSPLFQGAIEGVFVDPSDGTTPVVVGGFSMDAGYFDAFNSVRLTWYAPNGSKVGQKVASLIGIETFTVEGGSIARWRIETIKDEPAGFAIDNVSIKPLEASLIFREQSFRGGFWTRILNYIPGFDHVGLLVDDLVHESNVKHDPGIYVDKTGSEEVINDNSPPAADEGVQYYHTKGTFEWDALKGNKSTVTQLASVAIPAVLATNLRDRILTRKDAPFMYLGNGEVDLSLLVPENQKGYGPDGGFTCVGLIEWAAETSGHNGGAGFIKDNFEEATFTVVDNFAFAWPPVSFKTVRWGLLSPELFYQVTGGTIAQAADAAQDIKEWLQGFFDPVDFIITDPLGRRLGHSVATDTLQEIPRAFYSGDGAFEQFLIVGAIPGLYKIELAGLGEEATFGIASEKHAVGMEGQLLANGEKRVMYFVKEVVPGGMGDVDGDGDVDVDDVAFLVGVIPKFTDTPNDPGDLNGDGVLDEGDVALLQQLTEVVNEPYPHQVTVDDRVTVSYGAVTFNRRTQEFTIPATLTNTSNEDLAGPVWLVISSLSPSQATVTNASGNTADGRPYVQVIAEGVVWQAGQSLPKISLRIRNPIREPLNFEEQVLAIIP